MKDKKIILRIHTCKGKKKEWPHRPELRMEFKTIKEAISEGRELVKKIGSNAYINWNAKKGYRYVISNPNLVSRYRISKNEAK